MSRTFAMLAALAAVACRDRAGSQPVAARTAESGAAAPVAEEDPRAFCKAQGLACRENVHVVLRRLDGTTFERTVPIGPPPLADGLLSLLPGETIHVEAEPDGDALVLTRVVESPEHPGRTLTFRFSQTEGKPDMLLVVESPFDRPLKFELGMMLLEEGDAVRVVGTSSCPVMPGKQGFESWPQPILQLLARRFRLLPPGAALVCE